MIRVTGKDICLAVSYYKIKVANPLGIKDTVTTKYMRQNEYLSGIWGERKWMC